MKQTHRAFSAGASSLVGLALVAASFVGISPAQAAVKSPAIITPTDGAVELNLVGFNDFHGRILTADKFAATVIKARDAFPADKSLVLGNGDQVGASIFESFIQNDDPSIDALNALGVDSLTQGNHEFDKGMADAKRIAAKTTAPDLAANVTAADGSHPFGEYALFDRAGLKIAVVGAVTNTTPQLVSPDGIKGFTFGDPVEAVNRVTKQLKDGDATNGEADIVIASYHDGGPVAGSDKLDQNLANAAFKHMVNDTDQGVAAIFNAHTHMPYAFETGTTGRPVVQADSYGNSIAQVVLKIDPATKAVTAADESIIPALKAVPDDLKADKRITDIQAIQAAAVQVAGEKGAVQIASATAPASRAKVCTANSILADATTGEVSCGAFTTQDDRANESNLGTIIADSMVDAVAATGRKVDLAMMNPGGIRDDLIPGTNGQLTYKQAASVLPFANTLSYVQLKGSDLRAILEQQWQPAGASRPYLQLGLPSNVTYTYDSLRAAGQRITSVTINGKLLDPNTTYGVVAPNFLAAGGDNFTAFQKATAVEDSGLSDLESFVSWLKAKGTLPVDKARNGVEVSSFKPGDTPGFGFDFTGRRAPGERLIFTTKNFDLRSLGYIQNRKATVNLVGPGHEQGTKLAEANIPDNVPNQVGFVATLPEKLVSGNYTVQVVYDNSDTVVSLPITVAGNITDPSQAQPPVPPAPPVPTDTRIAGSDRFDTSVQVSKKYSTVGNPVVITSGANFADALAAGPVAGELDASLLLTSPDALSKGAEDEITRLAPKEVIIVGGEPSVSAAIETRVHELVDARAAKVTRVAGKTRVETAALLAQKYFPNATGAYLATGWNFPDALSASSAGTLNHRPVLLLGGQALDEASAAYLADAKRTEAVLVGGQASTGALMIESVPGSGHSISLSRLAGADRYGTNVAVNQATAPAKVDTVVSATGQNFPDALVASVVVDRLQAPLVLTPGTCVTDATRTYLTSLGKVSTVVLGSEATVAVGWRASSCS